MEAVCSAVNFFFPKRKEPFEVIRSNVVQAMILEAMGHWAQNRVPKGTGFGWGLIDIG